MNDSIVYHVTDEWKRSDRCGEIEKKDVGRKVTVSGWVKKVREFGEMTFVDLWDRSGLVQLVFDAAREKIHSRAKSLRAEDVIACAGEVRQRPPEMVNPDMKTGEVELYAERLVVFNKSKIPPFNVSDKARVNDDLRLKYRYLDLRRDSMQQNLALRHNLALAARNFLSKEGLMEVETPILVRRTPEGARDYLVPSRLHRGKFYALPQSPQLYKQILMVSGVDGYFQLARCLRDEDLRADRQPEHTQIDIEMSFVSEEEIIDLTERLMKAVFRQVRGIELETPFPRLDYGSSMAAYGTDKPDLRFGLEIKDCGEVFKSTGFQVFSKVMAKGGRIRGISCQRGFELSKTRVKKLESIARKSGAKGLVWIKTGEGTESPVEKYLSSEEINGLRDLFGLEDGAGSLILIVAGPVEVCSSALGALRKELGAEFSLFEEGVFKFVWVNRFPLFLSSKEGGLEPAHHIFSMPLEEDLGKLDSNPLEVRGYLYDLVCNGTELGSGSIRVHLRGLQEKLFELSGIDRKKAEERFGFLLESFEYGAPPHGGIALGLDRLAMIMGHGSSIREYIAFPKTQNATSLMEGAPSRVDAELLEELDISLRSAGDDE